MADPYPENIEIEIDHEGLCKYLRLTWFKALAVLFLFFGGLLGFVGPLEDIEKSEFQGIPWLIMKLGSGVLVGALIGVLIAVVIYFLFCHSKAKKVSQMLECRVEGAFLKVVHYSGFNKLDRKIHFRAVTDFSIIDDRRMQKFGIKALQMNTTGGSSTGLIRVDGIRDCEKVRDMLAEIDSQREV